MYRFRMKMMGRFLTALLHISNSSHISILHEHSKARVRYKKYQTSVITDAAGGVATDVPQKLKLGL